jgi:hypothetical protein
MRLIGQLWRREAIERSVLDSEPRADLQRTERQCNESGTVAAAVG